MNRLGKLMGFTLAIFCLAGWSTLSHGETQWLSPDPDHSGCLRNEVLDAFVSAPMSADKSSSNFGDSVFVHGDHALVGASGEPGANFEYMAGAAYVLDRDGNGWKIGSRLSVLGLKEGDRFGSDVCIRGDTAVIGSPGDDAGGEDAGAVYVFENRDGVWRNTAKLLLPDAGEYDGFGESVSVSDNYILATAQARGDDPPGGAFLFKRGSAGWVFQTRLRPPSEDAVSSLNAVTSMCAVTDEMAAVGAYNIYVFFRNGDLWEGPSPIPESGVATTSYDRGRMRFAIHGDRIVLGQILNYESGDARTRVFRKIGTEWVQEPVVIPDCVFAGSYFGWDVALSDDIAAILKRSIPIYGVSEPSRVFILVRIDDEWVFHKTITLEGDEGDYRTVQCVAAAGDDILIGGDPVGSGEAVYYDRIENPVAIADIPTPVLRHDADFTAIADLSRIFHCRSGCTPTFSAAADDNTEAVLQGSTLRLRPVPGFSGYSAVQVSATDGDETEALAFEAFALPFSDMIPAEDPVETNDFGRSVAVSGDCAVVGAPGDASGRPGAVCFFRKDDGGVWSRRQVETDGEQSSVFGMNVDISEDRAIVRSGETSARIYELREGAWQPVFALTSSQESPWGLQVAISGDYAMIGCPKRSAYLYVREDQNWTLLRSFEDPEIPPVGFDDPFVKVMSFALRDPWLAVGYRDETAELEREAVTLYKRDGDEWRIETVFHPDSSTDEGFGTVLAISGEHVAVSAPAAWKGRIQSGCVYLFSRAGDSWVKQRLDLRVSDTDLNAQTMALSGNRFLAISGEPGEMCSEYRQNAQQCAANLYEYDGMEWRLKYPFFSGYANGRGFFDYVSGQLTEDTLILGAEFKDYSRGGAVDLPDAVRFVDFTDASGIPPAVNAGYDQTVSMGRIVYLSGSSSRAWVGYAKCQWTQLSGPPVVFEYPTPEHAPGSRPEVYFTAPDVAPGQTASLAFQLTVTDSESLLQATDTVRVTIWWNTVPVSDAGASQTVAEGRTVRLDGSGSSSPDGNPLSYFWIQTSGPPVMLSDSYAVSPTFVPPSSRFDETALEFELTVTDEVTGVRRRSETIVTVTDNGITGFDDDTITFFSVYGQPMGIRVSENMMLVELNALDSPTPLLIGVAEMAFGLVRFVLKSMAYNTPCDVVLFRTEPLPALCGVYAYSEEGGWHEMAADIDSTGTRVSFSISESDPWVSVLPNGDMVLTVGAGCPEIPDSESNDTGGGGGCFFNSLMFGQSAAK